jgi:hypothetical protein
MAAPRAGTAIPSGREELGDVETFVRNGQRELRGLLASRGIPHEWHELPGAHFVRRDMLQRDIDGVIARLRKA